MACGQAGAGPWRVFETKKMNNLQASNDVPFRDHLSFQQIQERAVSLVTSWFVMIMTSLIQGAALVMKKCEHVG